jgi:large subunit ribosomal protein L6
MQTLTIPNNITLSIKDHKVNIRNTNTDKHITYDLINLSKLPFHKRFNTKKYEKTTNKLLLNNISGLYKGYLLKLQVLGIGYRVTYENNTLILKLGYSHNVNFPIPQDISVYITRSNKIILIGSDLAKVSQIASQIRKLKTPDNYKGKGIRYVNEQILIKEGKKRK